MQKILIPPSNDSQKHELDENVTFTWLQDGRVANIALTSLSRNAIDVYMNTTLQLLEASTDTETLLLLLNVSSVSGTTPYFKSRLEDVKDALQQTKKTAKAAIIIPSGGLGTTVFLLLRRVFSIRLPGNASDQLFQNSDEALKWLLSS